MKKALEKKIVWQGLTEYSLDEDDVVYNSDSLDGICEILNKMKVNQYYVAKTIPSEENTLCFDRYLERLKLNGIDIGKGDFEYGYKMPLPENGEERRELRIFRRK